MQGRREVLLPFLNLTAVFPLILAGDEVFNLGVGEHRPITAHIEITNITSSALTDTALHPLFQRGEHLLWGKT